MYLSSPTPPHHFGLESSSVETMSILCTTPTWIGWSLSSTPWCNVVGMCRGSELEVCIFFFEGGEQVAFLICFPDQKGSGINNMMLVYLPSFAALFFFLTYIFPPRMEGINYKQNPWNLALFPYQCIMTLGKIWQHPREDRKCVSEEIVSNEDAGDGNY